MAGPYSIMFRGPMAEKALPRLLHQSGHYLLATFRSPSPQGPPHELTVVVLDELSPQDRQLWQKRVRYEPSYPGEPLPRTWLITAFREYAAQGPAKRKAAREQFRQEFPKAARRLDETAYRYGHRPEDMFRGYWRGDFRGWRPICANGKITPDDIMAHCLFYLWGEGIMPSEEVTPWFEHWLQRYTRRKHALVNLFSSASKFALPLEANPIRPSAPALEVPDSLSVKEAEEGLGISPRRLRDLVKQGRITIEHRKALGPGAWRVLLTEVERLVNDPHFQQALRRQEDMRRGHTPGITDEALRQRIHQGPRKPDNTPNWDAQEARLKPRPARRRSRTDDALTLRLATLSPEALEDLHAELERLISTAETEDERLRLVDNRRKVEERREQLDRPKSEE